MCKTNHELPAVSHGDNVMVPEEFLIDKIRKNTEDTFTMDLVRLTKKEPFKFLPGQFNMLYINGVGEIPISISGDPSITDYITHTTRVVGSVTRGMRRLKINQTIGVRGPFGRPWPIKEAVGNDVVLVAGGIGLAPLRPVIYHILKHRKKYGRVVILYGTRTPDDILYRQELEQWRGRFDMNVSVTVDRGDNSWHSHVGVVTKLIPNAPFDPLNTIAITCGPEVMMRYTAMSLIEMGLPMEHIYVSLERNMKCGVGLCGHCQYTDKFICKDGPVFTYDQIKNIFNKREI